jgi:hypothetical protein
MFAEAFARPLAALDRGREVLLLKSPPPQAPGSGEADSVESLEADGSPATEVESNSGEDELPGSGGEVPGDENTADAEADSAAREESPGEEEPAQPADDVEQTP